jgi:Lipoxygenase
MKAQVMQDMSLWARAMWFVRRWFWNILSFVKMAGNKPLDIPVPIEDTPRITPMPLAQAVPELPVPNVLVCPPDAIPADEFARSKQIVYVVQLWLYKHFSPMQAGLPPVSADWQKGLKRAYTWLHRKKYPVPELPAEFLGNPDLGALAVRGPFACYTTFESDGVYMWDVSSLGRYAHHEGLHKLGAKVRFRVDAGRRALQAFEIECELGVVQSGQPQWALAQKIALCAVSTHLSLVRHFNWVHLACGAHFAIASRNELPAKHPLCRLLWPYFYGTQQSNDIVTRGQMVRGGDFETTFSLSFEGMCQLFGDSYLEYPFIVNDPEADGARRRLHEGGFDVPSQRNEEALFALMHAHALDYLSHIYTDIPVGSSTGLIRNDGAVLAWLDELNTLIPGGVLVTRDDVTLASLARLVARFMYLATVQHELMGSHLWNYQLWTHRLPVRVYQNGQREPLDVYQRLVNANYNLNVTRRALMHDFSYLALDAAGRDAMAKFERELAALQAQMAAQPWAVWKMAPAALKVNINA